MGHQSPSWKDAVGDVEKTAANEDIYRQAILSAAQIHPFSNIMAVQITSTNISATGYGLVIIATAQGV